MKKLAFFLFCLPVIAMAQGSLPWGYAVSPALLATQPGNAIFYVASYSPSGTHTAYDMARQAADSYLRVHPETPTFLILSPFGTETCDAVPLPTVSAGPGVASSISILGYGSNSSSILKRRGCAPTAATFAHEVSSSGTVTNALYQGFSVSAEHIDNAACEFYGMSNSIFLDIACFNARSSADHEVEFGTTVSQSAGMDTKITIYNLKTGDNVGVGRGAILTPGWSNGELTSITVTSGGIAQYTQQYARAQFVGSDLSSCSVLPVVVPVVSALSSVSFNNLPVVNYGWITGASIKVSGKCARTEHLYLLIQDGVPVKFGMKFSYTTKSRIWNLEAEGPADYGEGWLPKSGNNQIIGEHPYTNQTVQIAEYAVANQHLNTFFDGPGLYGAAIYGATGAFINAVFSWDSSAYLASSGYFLASPNYVNWTIQNSQCTDSTSNFSSFVNPQGPLASQVAPPSGLTLHDIERCDGSKAIDWATPVGSQ